MPFLQNLNFTQNPFENHTAETEPEIGLYAVRPPYLEKISEKAKSLSSFILFGDRGAGKSATRLTVFKELWAEAKNLKPFLIYLTDFTELQEPFRQNKLTDLDIVKLTAFYSIEQMLVWLSSLPEDQRTQRLSKLTAQDKTLIFALVKGFYLSKNDLDRELSTHEAFEILNSAWVTKSLAWTEKRWESLSKITSTILSVFTKKVAGSDDVDISGPAEQLLKSLIGSSPQTSRAILVKLVEFCQVFEFSGLCVMVDKLDETTATMSSSEATARLIHPLLSNTQLLEIKGLSWILFLWSSVQHQFNEKHKIRLDRISHANISWQKDQLREMLAKRVGYFSNGKLGFLDLFAEDIATDATADRIMAISVSSPRELIKLLEIIIREHDARNTAGLLNAESVKVGIDRYCTETIGTWYERATLQQIYRVGKLEFVSKDVQTKFKISAPAASVKLRDWENSGLIKRDGDSPSESGGKPVYKYAISDPRVAHIIREQLDATVGEDVDDGE
ncbi:P-loop ATPase, Sll1717 family [Pseudomonas viridiflava]|uniref:P-loop ATPase, Sll1717 family n=1 Tax=Pseudomonas viridiflava TaxID=33069 RepID=UPI001F11F033|nr:hypothetical protein [Pseudomonas viridiflava]